MRRAARDAIGLGPAPTRLPRCNSPFASTGVPSGWLCTWPSTGSLSRSIGHLVVSETSIIFLTLARTRALCMASTNSRLASEPRRLYTLDGGHVLDGGRPMTLQAAVRQARRADHRRPAASRRRRGRHRAQRFHVLDYEPGVVCPHTAFYDPSAGENHPGRRSVEFRALCNL